MMQLQMGMSRAGDFGGFAFMGEVVMQFFNQFRQVVEKHGLPSIPEIVWNLNRSSLGEQHAAMGGQFVIADRIEAESEKIESQQ